MKKKHRILAVTLCALVAAPYAQSVRAAWPTMTFLSGPVAPGGTAVVSGSDFKPSEGVTLYLQGARVQSGYATAAGSFILTFGVSTGTPPGNYTLQAHGSGGDSAWATLSVALPGPAPSPTSPPGATATPVSSPTAVGGGSNLLQNGGFEAGLVPWGGYHSVLTLTSPGHSGNSALRAAPWAPGQGLYYIVDYAGGNPWGVIPHGIPVPAGTYTASAWVMGVPGRTLQLCLRDGTASSIGGMDCASTVANGAWQQLTVSHSVSVAGANLDVWIGGYHYQSGDAITVDDVSLTG